MSNGRITQIAQINRRLEINHLDETIESVLRAASRALKINDGQMADALFAQWDALRAARAQYN